MFDVFHGYKLCKKCGVAPVRHVHHIDSDPQNYSPDNLMGLCVPCHVRHHLSHDERDRVAA